MSVVEGVRNAGASTRQVFAGIQVLRGLAAVAVVLFHVNLLFGPNLPLRGDAVGGLFLFGHSGVDLFFVLSGFIIGYAHWGDVSGWSAARRYVWRRIIRIYPMTIIVVASLALIAPLLRWFFSEPSLLVYDLWILIGSFFLVPVGCDYLPSVLWSLQNEIYFYSVFLLRFVGLRFMLTVFVIWIIFILAGLFAPYLRGLAVCQSSVLSLYNLLFFGGIISFLFVRYHPRIVGSVPASVWLGAGGLLFLLVGWVDVQALSSTYLSSTPSASEWSVKLVTRGGYGLASMLLVIGAASGAWCPKSWFARSIVLVGDSSFAIYLVHLPVIAVVSRMLTDVGTRNDFNLWGVFLILVASGVGAGILFHKRVEKPLLWVLRVHFKAV